MTYSRGRVAITGAIASMALLLSACGGAAQDGQESNNAGQSGSTQSQSGQSQSGQNGGDTAQGQQNSSQGKQGVTTVEDIYGPAAGKVPTDPSNEGSAKGMVDDPVATAASNNPLLKNLTKAVKTAGLVDTLNKSDANYTVFAPVDSAFEKLPPETLNALLTDPAKKQQLSDILTYHVVPKRMDAQQLGEAGEVSTVNGAKLDITGKGQNIKVNGAKVLVGNVPTANATVFVIDKVMMPSKN